MIKFYPNKSYNKSIPAVEKLTTRSGSSVVSGGKDITAAGLNVTISANTNAWKTNSISFKFSAATARDYTAIVKNGRKVVTDKNDVLWIYAGNVTEQMITLDQGFYTGTELAAHLKAKMDSNTLYTGLGITFTVSYSATTGLFVITPSSGNVKYMNANNSVTLRTTDSTAGHLFGFNADTAYAASISSDTTCFGLNDEQPIFGGISSGALSHYHDTTHLLTIDQAIKISTGTAAIFVDYEVAYEEII